MPRVLTGVSTIPTPGGKAAGCGARTATARPGSRKAARTQGRAPCTSSFGPIRWRTEVRGKFERPAARGCDAFAQVTASGAKRTFGTMPVRDTCKPSSAILLVTQLQASCRIRNPAPCARLLEDSKRLNGCARRHDRRSNQYRAVCIDAVSFVPDVVGVAQIPVLSDSKDKEWRPRRADRLRGPPPCVAVGAGQQHKVRAEQVDSRDLQVATLEPDMGL